MAHFKKGDEVCAKSGVEQGHFIVTKILHRDKNGLCQISKNTFIPEDHFISKEEAKDMVVSHKQRLIRKKKQKVAKIKKEIAGLLSEIASISTA